MRWWLVGLALSGCAIHPSYVRPRVAMPAGWHGTQGLGNTQPAWPARDWWRSFDDATLNELEQAALASNHDLQAALSRVAQARDTARIAGASLYPTLDARLRGKRGKHIRKSAFERPNEADLLTTFDPDIWGELHGLKRAAQAQALAASEASANTALAVAANVASSYFQLAAFDERIELVRQTIETARRIDALIETRYRAGAVSDLDEAQSKTSLANIQAGLPALELGREETLHALAILLAKSPAELTFQPRRLTGFSLPAILPVGLPSELLQRRPDIRQAEENLMAANADIGAARARLFPSIVLTGDGGYVSDQLSNLLKNPNSTLALGIELLAPIFHGGALRANVDRSTERYHELLQEYHQTVLGALRDVEDALVALQKLGAQEELLDEAQRQAKRAFNLAEIRYRAGAIDAFTMLTAQDTWLSTQNSVLQTRFARMNALVSLYKALGGGGPE
jgi:outer membrane protein, multidrug efflux system